MGQPKKVKARQTNLYANKINIILKEGIKMPKVILDHRRGGRVTTKREKIRRAKPQKSRITVTEFEFVVEIPERNDIGEIIGYTKKTDSIMARKRSQARNKIKSLYPHMNYEFTD
jgi:formate-dependent phosphoribosylglycinamide formyltransferase (GAR transformylase)